jgi:cob(I)alamin adenosyltransferase
MKKGYIQIYTGNGKGKTTAAMGLALRAAGHGYKVRIVQFLKGGVSGELESIKKLETVELYRVTDAERYIWDLTAEQKLDMQRRSKQMLDQTMIWFEEGIDILILDEIMAALQYDIVQLSDVLSLLDARSDGCEVILTGRNVPEALALRAHLISEVRDIKHYFDDGVPARKGIEF